MSLEKIARRYAVALADVTSERGEAEVIQAELLQWESMLSAHSQLKETLSDPTIPYEQKTNLLAALIDSTRPRVVTANFLHVLLRNRRIAGLAEINKMFAGVLNERAGIVSADVTVAREASEQSKQALLKRLVEMTGKTVRVTFSIDEGLIGGMVTRIGSTVYDTSVRNQLRVVREALAAE